jgi:hypothetical protein
MSLRRRTPSDSLYLLLDTLCNAFGGIILLAVLVVLLTNKERSLDSNPSESSELLQRRLKLAQNDLQKAEELFQSLQKRVEDQRWKAQIALVKDRKALQEELARTRDDANRASKELESANAADPAERLKFLNARLAEAQAFKLEARNRLAADQENVVRLHQRLQDLLGQVTTLTKEIERPVRLPIEHETGKKAIFLIARYGRIYSCRNPDLSINETEIVWTKAGESTTAEPIRGKGIDVILAPEAFRRFLSSQSQDAVYLAFCVFEDSFPVFLRAKQIAADAGFAYGWEPFRSEEGPVVFGSQGHKPKPL